MDDTIYNELHHAINWHNMPDGCFSLYQQKATDAIKAQLAHKEKRNNDESLLLAEIALGEHEYQQAYRYYIEDLQTAIKAHDYLVKRVCAMLQQNKYYTICYNILYESLQYMPRSPRLLTMMGTLLLETGQAFRAEQVFRYHITLHPMRFDGYSNLVVSLEKQGKYDILKPAIYEALQLEHMDANLHFALALHELRFGSFIKGTQMMFWRFVNNPHIIEPYTQRNIALWRGENINNCHILITTEQGYGDYIMYSRFLYDVKAQYPDARLTLIVRKELVEYMGDIARDVGATILERADDMDTPDTVHNNNHNNIVYDYFIPMMQLPAILRLDYAMIQPKIYGPILQKKQHKARLGLCYKGKSRHIKEQDIVNLLNLLNEPVQSLQYDAVEHDLLIALPPTITNFHQTASLIYDLDIIITIDSAIAHIAGALGKKVILLNDYNYCWRWHQQQRNKENYALWYHHMFMIRAPDSYNNFSAVWPQVLAQLQEFTVS